MTVRDFGQSKSVNFDHSFQKQAGQVCLLMMIPTIAMRPSFVNIPDCILFPREQEQKVCIHVKCLG